jgi:O2-independent ubiquinone biosynthesis protein UbiU
MAVLAYARAHHPQLRLHLSVQASATNRGDRVLPRALRHPARRAAARADAVAGAAPDPHTAGRDRGVRLRQPVRDGRGALPRCRPTPPASRRTTSAPVLAGRRRALGRDRCRGRGAAGRHADRPLRPDEPRGYPTLCKGRFDVGEGERGYAIEEPTSLNTLAILPQLIDAGVAAIKIEGRQRSPSLCRAGHARVAPGHRPGQRPCRRRRGYSVQPAWNAALARWAEGQQHTLGAYDRPWR